MALNQKVVDKLLLLLFFFKGLRRGGGSSPGHLVTASLSLSLSLSISFSNFLSSFLNLAAFPDSFLLRSSLLLTLQLFLYLQIFLYPREVQQSPPPFLRIFLFILYLYKELPFFSFSVTHVRKLNIVEDSVLVFKDQVFFQPFKSRNRVFSPTF